MWLGLPFADSHGHLRRVYAYPPVPLLHGGRYALRATTHFHVAGSTSAYRQVAALWKHLTTSRKSPVTITKADHGVELFDLPSISGSLHVAPRRRWADTSIGVQRQVFNGTSPWARRRTALGV